MTSSMRRTHSLLASLLNLWATINRSSFKDSAEPQTWA